MMLLFWLALLSASEPEQQSSYYMLAMNLAQMLPRWERSYDASLNGFYSTQGSLNTDMWYLRYRGKIDSEILGRFRIRYRYEKEEDYGESKEIHRFEPTLSLGRDLYCHLMLSPTFKKYENDAGIGFSLYPGPLDYLEAFFIAEDFENNAAMRDRPEEEKILYRRQPYRLSVQGRKEISKGWISFLFEYVTRSKKETVAPDYHSIAYSSRFRTEERFYITPIKRLQVGTALEFLYRGDCAIFSDSTTSDTLKQLRGVPFVSFSFAPLWSFNLQYLLNYRIHNHYRAFSHTPMAWFEYGIRTGMALGFGYQRGMGKRWHEESEENLPSQNEIVLSLEVFRGERIGLLMREGINIDNLGFEGSFRQSIEKLHETFFAGILVLF